MNEDKFEEKALRRLKERARDYNAPPETPRETMWARIQAERSKRRETYRSARGFFWLPRKIWLPAAAAAVLTLGIVIGRMSIPADRAPSIADHIPVESSETMHDRGGVDLAEQGVQQPVRGMRGRGESASDQSIFQLAAVPVLSKAELLLTQYRTGTASDGNGDTFTSRAAALLIDTRLLLDSPASDDPDLQALLSDLELILAQIVRITSDGKDEDKQWIENNLKQRSILPRLRTKVPEGKLAMYL